MCRLMPVAAMLTTWSQISVIAGYAGWEKWLGEWFLSGIVPACMTPDVGQHCRCRYILRLYVFLMLKCINMQMNSDTSILVYFNLVGAGHLHACHDWIWTLRQAGCLCCQMVGKINNLTGSGVRAVMRVASWSGWFYLGIECVRI